MIQGKSIRMSKKERNLLAELLNKYIAALQDKCKAQAQNNENNYRNTTIPRRLYISLSLRHRLYIEIPSQNVIKSIVPTVFLFYFSA